MRSEMSFNAAQGNEYEHFYYQYLSSIAFQLFKWENLPPGVNENFLEKTLHETGRIAFVKHDKLGFIVANGSPSGLLDIYGLPNQFQCVFPNAQMNYMGTVYNYEDDLKEMCNTVVISNNEFNTSTLPNLRMFARDLAHIKRVKKININNQKTPYIITTNQEQLMSVKKFMNQMNADLDNIIVDKKLDPSSLSAVQTPAPYVADKLNEELSYTWNEVMTYLGIENNNQLKKERMIVDEVNGNNEQTQASENMWLKVREEACDRINRLWGLNVKVSIRTKTQQELQQKANEEKEENNEL